MTATGLLFTEYYGVATTEYWSDLWVSRLPSGQAYSCEITCWLGWIR